MLDKIEKSLCNITKRFVEGHAEFCMWEARVRADWAKDPKKYDESMHREIDKIASLWLQCGSMLHSVLRWADDQNLSVSDADKANDIYAMMLSVELMDLAPLPDHLANLAQEAAAKWKVSQGA